MYNTIDKFNKLYFNLLLQNRTCLDGHLKCNNGKCVHNQYVCNGYNDCVDNSDEDANFCKV